MALGFYGLGGGGIPVTLRKTIFFLRVTDTQTALSLTHGSEIPLKNEGQMEGQIRGTRGFGFNVYKSEMASKLFQLL